jgi:hypothetical protein
MNDGSDGSFALPIGPKVPPTLRFEEGPPEGGPRRFTGVELGGLLAVVVVPDVVARRTRTPECLHVLCEVQSSSAFRLVVGNDVVFFSTPIGGQHRLRLEAPLPVVAFGMHAATVELLQTDGTAAAAADGAAATGAAFRRRVWLSFVGHTLLAETIDILRAREDTRFTTMGRRFVVTRGILAEEQD